MSIAIPRTLTKSIARPIARLIGADVPGYHPTTAAYVSSSGITGATAKRRIDTFIRGVDDLGLTILDGVLLGRGLNNDTSAITLIGHAEATTAWPTGTEKLLHGYMQPMGPAGGPAVFPMASAVGDGYSMVGAFNGRNFGNGFRFMGPMLAKASEVAITSLGIYHNHAGSGEGAGVNVGTFIMGKNGGSTQYHPTPLADYRANAAAFATMIGVDAVSFNGVVNDATLPTPYAFARTYAGLLDSIAFGTHTGLSHGAVVFASALSDAQRLAVYRLAKRTIFSSGVNLVVEGDSQIYGFPGDANWSYIDRLNWQGKWAGACGKYTNISWGGENLKQFMEQAQAGSLDIGIPTDSHPKSWLYISLSGNAAGSSADFTAAKMVEYLGATAEIAKQKGFERVIAQTCFRSFGTTTPVWDVVSAANTLLKNRDFPGEEFIDEIFDIELAMVDVAATADYWTVSALFSDGIHLTDSTNQALADWIDANNVFDPPRATEV